VLFYTFFKAVLFFIFDRIEFVYEKLSGHPRQVALSHPDVGAYA
jgi:hypothetical protein